MRVGFLFTAAAAAALASLALPARGQGVHLPIQQDPQPFSPIPITWRLPAPGSVMWIAAHPDDEVLVAPLLARWCGDGHARCSLLVATRGEAGACRLPGGCRPARSFWR